MIEPTEVTLPASLIFPVEIVGILEEAGARIDRHAALVRYKYWVEEQLPSEEGEDQVPDTHIREHYSVFESPIEGEISEWFINVGDSISDNKTRIVCIVEPCTHPVQFGGLCAVCGMSLDTQDYTEYDNKQRAPISMAHDTSGLKVSYAEAARIEKSLEKQLQQKRKLILVVDLDQTVIQAAVDPTIKEWMQDKTNPNFDAVKDVQSFSLEETVQPKRPGAHPEKTQCWYYVKMRPGLEQFLREMNQLYEMHVYTMATKAYAKAITQIIDPKGVYFSDRILSRDESGSLTQKSLQRLFPVSTSMVAIIDDRGDVWSWSSNLIKVVPYNFFVGIGDINSSFLPKKTGELEESTELKERMEHYDADGELETKNDGPNGEINNGSDAAKVDAKDPETEDSKKEHATSEDIEPEGTTGSEKDSTDILMKDDEPTGKIETGANENQNSTHNGNESDENKSDKENDDPIVLSETAEQMNQRTASLEAQQQERPLAKLQESQKAKRLLVDNDTELPLVEKALRAVHAKFYEEFDRYGGKVEPDLKKLMPKMKSRVFDGCVILFSGIIPLGTNLDSADIVQWVRSFGAVVVGDFVDSVTHVVGTSKGTSKVRQAIARKGTDIHIVYSDWVMASLGAWERVDEAKYEMKFSTKELDMIQKSTPNVVDVDVDLDVDLGDDDDEDFVGTEKFVQSLKQGDMNWEDIDKELEEFMGSDSDEEDEENGEDENAESNKRQRDDEESDDHKKAKVDDISNEDNEDDDEDDDSSIDEDFLKELENDLM